MNILVNGVNIILTKEQLAEIARQTTKQYKTSDIDSVITACDILNEEIPCKFTGESNSSWAGRQLELIIKAANYLDNSNAVWIADFTDNSYKYIPYFKKDTAGSALLVYAVVDYCSFSHSPVWVYFKNRDTADKIANKFITLYSSYIG